MRSRQNGSGVTLSFGRSEQNEKKINHSGSLMKWVSEEMVSVLLPAIICFLKTQAPVTHLRCLNNSRYLLTAVSSAIHLGSLCNSEALIGSSQKQRGRTWEHAAVSGAGAVEPLALSLLGSPADVSTVLQNQHSCQNPNLQFLGSSLCLPTRVS